MTDVWDTLWHGLHATGLTQLPLPAALGGLFALALLSATLLPLGSEAALLALAHTHEHARLWIWLVATAGNTLGGLITYAMGRGAHRLMQRPPDPPEPAAPTDVAPPGGPAHQADQATQAVPAEFPAPHASAPPATRSGTATPGATAPGALTPHAPSSSPAAPVSQAQALARRWVQRHGALVCLLSWLPGVGDPLCAAAGWLRLSFWRCALAIAVGKGARYAVLLGTLSGLG
ncbi:hypothetical protein CCO03_15995 [Comamonas serinivorans]|uniref:DedA family protein n=1 Tax=Comamonas serinivorans TaxID=1082851 RepID=A0A1Y0ERM9_9BURK|nr:DedA family protein [Comamonas serinivorans]ARU05969.1 hypothetical protein CCO03_15995 [Comamonas serinivorans]